MKTQLKPSQKLIKALTIFKGEKKSIFRPAIEFIHVTEEFIEATNGRELLRFHFNYGLEPGLYDIVTANKKKELVKAPDVDVKEYPPTNRVMPERKDKYNLSHPIEHSLIEKVLFVAFDTTGRVVPEGTIKILLLFFRYLPLIDLTMTPGKDDKFLRFDFDSQAGVGSFVICTLNPPTIQAIK